VSCESSCTEREIGDEIGGCIKGTDVRWEESILPFLKISYNSFVMKEST
jgi:hypothetical protein